MFTINLYDILKVKECLGKFCVLLYGVHHNFKSWLCVLAGSRYELLYRIVAT